MQIQSGFLKLRSVVPRWVQMVAVALPAAGIVAALGLVVFAGVSDGRANRDGDFGGLGVAAVIALVGAGLLFVSGWILALGFVYGDAKRRGMRAGLWALTWLPYPKSDWLPAVFLLCGNRFSRPAAVVAAESGKVRDTARFAARSNDFLPCRGSAPDQSFPMTAAFPAPGGLAPSGVAGSRQAGLSMRSFSAGFAVWTGIFLAKSVFAYLRHRSVGLHISMVSA